MAKIVIAKADAATKYFAGCPKRSVKGTLLLSRDNSDDSDSKGQHNFIIVLSHQNYSSSFSTTAFRFERREEIVSGGGGCAASFTAFGSSSAVHAEALDFGADLPASSALYVPYAAYLHNYLLICISAY